MWNETHSTSQYAPNSFTYDPQRFCIFPGIIFNYFSLFPYINIKCYILVHFHSAKYNILQLCNDISKQKYRSGTLGTRGSLLLELSQRFIYSKKFISETISVILILMKLRFRTLSSYKETLLRTTLIILW